LLLTELADTSPNITNESQNPTFPLQWINNL